MARRPPRARLSRTSGVTSAPIAVESATADSGNTPATPGDSISGVQSLAFDQLTLQDAGEVLGEGGPMDSSLESAPKEGQDQPQTVSRTLRFLDLPSELRIRVYSYHFTGIDPVQDLSPENHKKVLKKLAILRTCRRIYHEASHYFYSSHSFRIFPTHPGRFFKTRRPLLVRLTTRQKASMTRLELRLGPGFNKPPKCWAVTKKLGLPECTNVRKISVFVQLDPSHSWLDGFRKPGFYEGFSCNLLDDILRETPNVEAVEFDGYESVRKNCPIMEGLIKTTLSHGKRVAWGPYRGWTDADEENGGKVVSGSSMLEHGSKEVAVLA